MSYYILSETQSKQVLQTLVPICLGVCMIVWGSSNFHLVGLIYALSANVASAARNVFYKTKMHSNNPPTNDLPTSSSPFSIFLNVGFVSFIIYTPIYFIHILSSLSLTINIFFDFFTFLFDYTLAPFSSPRCIEYLIYGSLFNFLYNLFSLRVLANVTPISHSVINIMKRVFIVICSTLTFATPITCVQWTGMMLADVGVFSYSIVKMNSSNKIQQTKVKNVSDLNNQNFYKKLVVLIVSGILLRTSISPTRDYLPDQSLLAFSFNTHDDTMRLKCIRNIQGSCF